MAPVLIQLVLAPALIAAATLAERICGLRVAGVLAAFPAIVGPVLLVTSLEHGVHAAARAADGTLLGLVALSAFAVAYAGTARRRGWSSSLAAGWLAAALASSAAGEWLARLGAVSAGAFAVMSLSAAGAALRWGRRQAPPRSPIAETRPALLAPRAAVAALLVTLLSLAVGWLGPTAGGMLAALPVVASMLAVFTHRRSGPRAALEILHGTIIGMAGFVAFCELVALTIAGAGTAAAFALATTAALLCQGLLTGGRGYPVARNSAGRSGEASASARLRPSASQSAA